MGCYQLSSHVWIWSDAIIAKGRWTGLTSTHCNHYFSPQTIGVQQNTVLLIFINAIPDGILKSLHAKLEDFFLFFYFYFVCYKLFLFFNIKKQLTPPNIQVAEAQPLGSWVGNWRVAGSSPCTECGPVAGEMPASTRRCQGALEPNLPQLLRVPVQQPTHYDVSPLEHV